MTERKSLYYNNCKAHHEALSYFYFVNSSSFRTLIWMLRNAQNKVSLCILYTATKKIFSGLFFLRLKWIFFSLFNLWIINNFFYISLYCEVWFLSFLASYSTKKYIFFKSSKESEKNQRLVTVNKLWPYLTLTVKKIFYENFLLSSSW